MSKPKRLRLYRDHVQLLAALHDAGRRARRMGASHSTIQAIHTAIRWARIDRDDAWREVELHHPEVTP